MHASAKPGAGAVLGGAGGASPPLRTMLLPSSPLAAGLYSSPDTAAEARLRSGCEARGAFAAEIARPKPDDLAIAISVAAEEHPDEPLSVVKNESPRWTSWRPGDDGAPRANVWREHGAATWRARRCCMFDDGSLPEENHPVSSTSPAMSTTTTIQPTRSSMR